MKTQIPCAVCGEHMAADFSNNIWCENDGCDAENTVFNHREARAAQKNEAAPAKFSDQFLDEQIELARRLDKVFQVFSASEAQIRPHFVLTGGSGSGKSHVIKTLAEAMDVGYFEINAAQLTKEGTSGNSLSKALAPLREAQGKPVICFVDEFDKLFISGNANSELAHETTNGVQNEFLKVLESDYTSVFADYGKYAEVAVDNVLFVFAGAFNGEKNITLDRLREMGLKTEFLGRVGLVFNTKPISQESLIKIVERSPLLKAYLEIFSDADPDKAKEVITNHVIDNCEANTLGVRMVNTLIHQYFINGGKLEEEVVEASTFQRTLKLD